MSFTSSLFAAGFGASQSGSTPGWISQMVTGFGGPTFAGTAVNEHTAIKVTAVFRAIALIADAVSMLPIDVLQRVGDRREDRSDHPVAELLRRPNPLMTSIDLRGAEQAHALQYGNAYLDIRRNERGDPIELWPLLPDRTMPIGIKRFDDEREIVYRTIVASEQIHISPKDVIHVHGLSFDGIRGYRPLQLAREAVGLALGLEEFAAKFFSNDAKSGGFLEHPGLLNDEAHKHLTDSMQAQGGLGNAHRIKILEEGMKFNATTIAPEDAQFLSTRGFQIEEIARIYGVPLHMLQQTSKTTSWGTGLTQMQLSFVMYSLGPWLVRWEQELDRKLFTDEEIAAGFFTRHNVNALLRADAAARARFYNSALDKARGWLARDEVRALEDLNPDDIANEAAAPAVPGFAPADNSDDEPPDNDNDNDGDDDGDDEPPDDTTPKEQQTIFGYHLQNGVVEINEARANLNLPDRGYGNQTVPAYLATLKPGPPTGSDDDEPPPDDDGDEDGDE